ncbi:zf-CCHC domain-containing protein [Tanacetum coccineum]
MQRPPLFESDHFIYWKNRFETYVKAKDLDLWHIILNGDFPPVARNKETQILEMVPFEQQDDDLKKKLAKNNEAKMVLYNVLPKMEYERIFMGKTAKDILQSLLITHQGNSQVKDNKNDLLVQKYEQFTILEEESIDSGFARFNTIITRLKAPDEGFSSKNYVRKFLKGLHPKWRAKVMAIEESKDLSSLALDEHIANQKYAMAVRNFKKFYRRKGKFVRQPREEKKSFRQRDEKKGKSDRKCHRCGDPNNLIGDCPKPSRNEDQKAFIGGSWSDSKNDAEDKTNNKTCLMAQSSNEVTLNSSYYSDNASSLDNDNGVHHKGSTDPTYWDLVGRYTNHLIGDCPKPSRNKDQKAFIGGSWSDSENDGEDKTNDETCLMAQSSNEVCLRTYLEPDEWIKDSGCSKHMTGNKSLFSTYKAYDDGNVVFGSNLKGKVIGKCMIYNDSLTISNVEHVDNLAFNLLSVGQICDNKCQVLFTEEGSKIIKDSKTIGNGIKKNGLYVMKLGNKSQDKLCLAMIVDNSTLWHRRFGHANMRLIQSLSSKELVRNLPKLKYDKHFCDACKIVKQAHASHKAKNMVSTKNV